MHKLVRTRRDEHMGDVTRLDEVRKRHKMRHYLRLAIAVVAIVAIAIGGTILFRYYSLSEVPELVKEYFSAFSGGPGYPIDSPGGAINDLYKINGDLAVINDTNIYLYNASGKEVGNIQHKYQNPRVCTAGKKILLYDRGGKELTMYKGDDQLLTRKMNSAIYTAALASNGNFAVATGGDKYPTQIAVYNQKQEELFVWAPSGKYILATALSPSGDLLAVGSVYSQGGEIRTNVSIFKLHTSEENALQAEFDLQDSMLLNLTFSNEDELHALTDSQALSYSIRQDKKVVYDFNGQSLSAFSMQGDNTVLLLGDYLHEQRYTLISLDGSMKQQGSAKIDRQVHKIKSDSGHIYLLYNNMLEYMAMDCTSNGVLEIKDALAVQTIGHSLYVITSDELQKFSLGKAQKEPASAAEESFSS